MPKRLVQLISIALTATFLLSTSATQTQAATPNLQLSPSTTTPSQGQSFDVNILINTATTEITGATATIEFDASKLEITQSPVNGDAFSQLAKWYDNPQGQAGVNGFFGFDELFRTFKDSGTLASIKFKVKSGQSGSAVIKFICSEGGPETQIFQNAAKILSCSNLNQVTINIPQETQPTEPPAGDTPTDPPQPALSCNEICEPSANRCPGDSPWCLDYKDDNLPKVCGRTENIEGNSRCDLPAVNAPQPEPTATTPPAITTYTQKITKPTILTKPTASANPKPASLTEKRISFTIPTTSSIPTTAPDLDSPPSTRTAFNPVQILRKILPIGIILFALAMIVLIIKRRSGRPPQIPPSGTTDTSTTGSVFTPAAPPKGEYTPPPPQTPSPPTTSTPSSPPPPPPKGIRF